METTQNMGYLIFNIFFKVCLIVFIVITASLLVDFNQYPQNTIEFLYSICILGSVLYIALLILYDIKYFFEMEDIEENGKETN